MFKRILVAYDNGDKAKKAVEEAIEIAKDGNGEICLLSSVKMPGFITTVTTPDMIKDLQEDTRKYFTEVLKGYEEKIINEGIKASFVILDESPGKGIVRYAEKENFDLIIMGSANRGTVERIFLGLGSVSNYVLQHAKCPVLVVKG
ncbi:MAG TPA: universal stress protein [Desulfotomaculum sp.]|nr:MAG: UspA domain protein [Desulfotomaculum sp. 46_80]HAG10501.1 universal stress protein [Desulfotomaculum sp.]HBY04076.1 universal stress protein [Desulfotomaculum sp.]